MKARLDRVLLATAMNRLARTVGENPIVLNGVRLVVADDAVALETSDIDRRTHVVLNAADVTPGEAIVPCRVLGDLVTRAEGDDINFEVIGGRFKFVSETTRSDLATYPDEWPNGPTVPPGGIPLSEGDWLSVKRVTTAAEALPGSVLAGVYFAGNTVSATDRYKLAQARLGVDVPACLVPAATVEDLSRAGVDRCTIAVGPRAVRFESGNTTWTSLRIEGEFGDLTKALTRVDKATTIEVLPPRVLTAMSRVAAVGRLLPVTLIPHQSGFEVLATDQELGEVRDLVEGDSLPFEVQFRAEVLRTALTALDGTGPASMELTAPNQKVIFRQGSLAYGVLPRVVVV